MIPEAGHPAGGIGHYVPVPDLPFVGVEAVMGDVEEGGEFSQYHRAVFVADVGPVTRRGLRVGAEGIEAHLPCFGDEIVFLLAGDDVAPFPLKNKV